jgi:hypothetical protein
MIAPDNYDEISANDSLLESYNDSKDCFSCSHQDVCVFKTEFLALKQKVALDIVNKDKPFDVIATCRHFSKKETVLRNLV